MNILITGGAGYIGKVLTSELLNLGHNLIIVDNSRHTYSLISALSEDCKILVYRNDVANSDLIFSRNKVDAVIHLAAESTIDAKSQECFSNNIVSGISLLNAMVRYGITKLIFASSCSVYKSDILSLSEDSELEPMSAYGESKLVFEKLLKWYSQDYELEYITFRYFNVAGATDKVGDSATTRLIPNLCKAVITGKPLEIYGSDYLTRDGTALRDYVHVLDIVNAHILALSKIEELSGMVFNLGSSINRTVNEVIATAKNTLGKSVPMRYCPRRLGDLPYAVADISLAQNKLGWNPKHDLESIIQSQYEWMIK